MTPCSPEPATDAAFFDGVDTLPALLDKRAALTPDAPAYFIEDSARRWSARTWSEFRQDVGRLSAAFERHGINPGSRVGILAGTSLGWETAQMAALFRGATVAGIDPYYPDALLNEIVPACGLTDLIVQDAATAARLASANRESIGFIASIDGGAGYPSLMQLCAGDQVSSRSRAEPEAAALVTFSSGSTGKPKPIAYSHAQVVHACRCLLQVYAEVSPAAPFLCWLPLANLFQRMMNFCALAKGAASYVVPDPRRVMEVLPIAKPQVFAAVPRFCEKLHAGMMGDVARNALLARIVERSISLGAALRDRSVSMSPIRRLLAMLADRLVLARIRKAMGGRLEFIVSGSAPMPRWLLDRFEAIGIPILEAYGVSENLVPVAANRLTQRKYGTVGMPAGDNEVRIATDGEVQVRGRGVFLRGLGQNAAHAEVLTDDGFLATGDLGALDDAGFLTLHGRRVEAFKNAQGRWVFLPLIEAALRRLPGVEHAAAVRMPEDRLIGVLALAASGPNENLRASLRQGFAALVETLPRAMRPVALLVVSAGFSPPTGELTTNLKLRRTVIAEKFADALRILDGENRSPHDGELPVRFV
jgi:long-chain acyl-CoA synthetase